MALCFSRLFCLVLSIQLILCISKLNRTIEEVEFGNRFWHEFIADFKGVGFSGVFTDNTILQRGPELSSVYGLADSPNKLIMVSLTNMADNNEEIWETYSHYSTNGSEWKVTFTHPYNSGGNYTLNVKCDGCLYQNVSSQTLVNITFGDIYLLTGQSNMELTMHYTLSRNITYANIRNGRYKTIRYYKINPSLPTGTNVTYVIPYSDEYIWNMANQTTLDDRSAFGWYFAQSLYDLWNITNIPIGLIDVSQGGSHIEEWIQNQTVQLSCKYSDCPDVGCGFLYGMRIAPYINMTIKAFLWYQGENSCAQNTVMPGYACMQSFMVNQWRNQWSVIPGTTSPMAPFGLVTLAAGTDEGCTGMGAFRQAQLADYGYTPNNALPNVFSALGHDCGDPWMYYNAHTGCATSGANYACLIMNDSYIPPWNWNETHYLMGDIHPRPKRTLAQRLAAAGYGILYNNSNYDYMTIGPLISKCKLNNQTWKIIISFNETFLMGNKVDYIPFISNGTRYPHTSGIQVQIGTNWYYVENITTNGRENDNEIIVDVSGFKGKNIIGISYAWTKAPCCGLYTGNGFNWATTPCPVNSCEIRAGGNTNNATDLQLPAVPFQAKIVNNSCVCAPPQICSG